MQAKPKNLFLLDAIGAVISATMLGIVLPFLNEHIGMPINILYSFAALAVCFACFSFYNYFNFDIKKIKNLNLIGAANLLYCLFSLIAVYFYWANLSILGIVYFLVEKIIVSAIAVIEFRNAKQHK